jgi:hypothetical protein
MKKTLKFLKEHKQFTFFGILAILIILAAIFAPLLTGGVDPLKGSLTEALEAPSKEHIFGTDKMGRDIYARVIYGARASLTSTFGVVVLIFLVVDTDGDGIRELDGQNINLHYVSYENRLLNDFSNAHIQYLAEIGIGCTADYGSSDDQWSKLAAGDYDFNNNNWITVGTGDPYAYMANWATDTTYCGYSNPEYDELFEQLKSEMDEDKRADLIFQMQQILVDDAAVLIDGYYNSSMIYSKNVGNAHIHTADYYWLTTEITPAQ